MTGRASLQRAQLNDAVEQAERDLAELDVQVAEGEIQEALADTLRSRYRSERDRLRDELAALDVDVPASKDEPRGRRIVGAFVIVAGFAVLAVGVAQSIESRPAGGFVTGGISEDVATGEVDLSQVTNEEMEAVIAENPEIAPMRIALARRYFESGELDQALDHYLVILEQGSADFEVLANVGWITYLGGEADVAERYVTRAVEAEPRFAQAHWYLGNIRLFGLNDPDGAIEPLETLLGFDDLPADIAAQASALLEQAKAAT